MKQISLRQGRIAILDDEDHDRLSHHHWVYRSERDGNSGYAMRHAKQPKGPSKTVYLHREITDAPPGMEVIFLNFDRLDCRRVNLKVVNKEEARRHHRVRNDCDSGTKGLKYNPSPQTWTARIYRNGQMFTIGTFLTKREALDAYHARCHRENPDLQKAPEVVERRRLV